MTDYSNDDGLPHEKNVASQWHDAVQGAQIFSRSIVTDLQAFGWTTWIFAAIFGALNVLCSFIDFNRVLGLDNSLPSIFTWENDHYRGFDKGERIIMLLSGAASFTGVMSVILTAKGKLSCYFWGLINAVLYGMFAWTYGYAGEAQLNVFFFIPMQFLGVYSWIHHRDADDTVISQSLTRVQCMVGSLLTLGLAITLYYEIPAFSIWLKGYYVFEDNHTPRLLDTSATTLNVVAQVLMLTRHWEQWFFWIAVNVIQISMYSGVAGFGVNFNILAMWSLFLVNAFYGLWCWYTLYQRGQDVKNERVDDSSPSSASDSDVESNIVDEESHPEQAIVEDVDPSTMSASKSSCVIDVESSIEDKASHPEHALVEDVDVESSKPNEESHTEQDNVVENVDSSPMVRARVEL